MVAGYAELDWFSGSAVIDRRYNCRNSSGLD